MSTQHLLIDNLPFAKRREHFSDSFMLSDCARLSDLLQTQVAGQSKREFQSDAPIRFTLSGEVNSMGQCFLNLVIDSELLTLCQRCLEPMTIQLNLRFNYLITEHGVADDTHEDSDDYDIQEASQAMDVLALIEDELIMALPIAPTHERDCGPAVMQSGEESNPFAILKGLIKS